MPDQKTLVPAPAWPKQPGSDASKFATLERRKYVWVTAEGMR